MKGRFVLLILVTLVLIWNFVISSSKLELSDRAKVLQGISLTKPYKEAIAAYWQSESQFPTKEDWKSGKLALAETLEKSLVETIIVGEETPGSISVYFTSRKVPNAPAGIEGKKVVFTPFAQEGKVTWRCKGTLAEDLLPVPCR